VREREREREGERERERERERGRKQTETKQGLAYIFMDILAFASVSSLTVRGASLDDAGQVAARCAIRAVTLHTCGNHQKDKAWIVQFFRPCDCGI